MVKRIVGRLQMCSMGCGFPATFRVGMTALCERGCTGRGEF